mgnify:FL=1
MPDFSALSLNALSQFHFLRPLWLWALLPLFALWLAKRHLGQNTEWQQFLPPHLARVLLSTASSVTPRRFWSLLVF